jgi:hypothetical protein
MLATESWFWSKIPAKKNWKNSLAARAPASAYSGGSAYQCSGPVLPRYDQWPSSVPAGEDVQAEKTNGTTGITSSEKAIFTSLAGTDALDEFGNYGYNIFVGVF